MLQSQREKTQNKTKKQDESVQGLKKQTVALIALYKCTGCHSQKELTTAENENVVNRHTQRPQVIMI